MCDQTMVNVRHEFDMEHKEMKEKVKKEMSDLQDSLQEIASLKRRLQRCEIILGLSSITVIGFISYRLLKK